LRRLKGTIIKSTGSWYNIIDENAGYFTGRIRGKLRLENKDTSNPIAVGDNVEFELDPAYENTVIITKIYSRFNYIIRKSNKLSAQRQVIAANIDLAVMIATVVAPRTSSGFIDRFLVCCEAFHIPVILFFNKTDLLNDEGLELLKDWMQLYNNAGYEVLAGSAKLPETLEKLHARIKGKSIMELGHSGVGKSTILNTLYPLKDVKTQAINVQHARGKHTTTFAEMHIMPDGTRFIDTPGIRDFGVVDVPGNEIGQFFPEIRKISGRCKFNDCQHTNEPDCAVKAAVENGNISAERYYSYISILNGEDVFE
jgi:ribosome biogenesis GTPase